MATKARSLRGDDVKVITMAEMNKPKKVRKGEDPSEIRQKAEENAKNTTQMVAIPAEYVSEVRKKAVQHMKTLLSDVGNTSTMGINHWQQSLYGFERKYYKLSLIIGTEHKTMQKIRKIIDNRNSANY